MIAKQIFRFFPRYFARCSLIASFSLMLYTHHNSKKIYKCQEETGSNEKKNINPSHDNDAFKMYLSQMSLHRFSALEKANRPHLAFYHDGIRNILNCFDKYEIYSNDIMIKKYEKNQKLDPEEKKSFGSIFLLFKANEITQGHKGITHGGLIATIVDHFMGRVSEMTADGDKVATANLNLNYKKPILVGSDYLMEISFEKIEKERKIFLTAKVLNEKFEICLVAEALFLKVKW